MPRQAAVSVENNFTRGLITEMTAMNFPENAVTDANNVIFSEFGEVTRRPGFDFETGYQKHNIASISSGVYSEFAWNIYQNDEGLTLLVQQIADRLWFFDTSSTISNHKKSFTVSLSTFKSAGVTTAQLAQNFCQFTQGKGFLFVVHPFCDPFSVSYDIDTDTITTSIIEIQVRDFERLDDDLEVNERPATLSNKHNYNLLNQGWYAPVLCVVHGFRGIYDPVLDAWEQSDRGDWPSNADIWWVYKNSQEWAYFGKGYAEKDSVPLFGPENFTLGNTPAPNGHYIYKAWNIDRTTKTGITNIDSLSSGQARPSTVAFYAGRVFYAGVGADKYSDKIYFTQIIESDDQFGKCYQVNDPTSETSFDLLESDGGVISIPSIAKIIALKIVGESLVVLGTNGVYVIRGTENGSFKATDYTIEYLSSVGATSHTNAIDVDGNLMWWNFDALYALSKDQSGLAFQIQNVSKQTIQSVIDSVPSENKPYIKSAFNRREQIVYWLFSDIDNQLFTYNRILAFNVISKAFYTFTIDQTQRPRLVGIISLLGNRQTTVLEDVIASGVTVTTSSGASVQIEEATSIPQSEVFVFATAGNIIGVTPTPGFTYSLLDQTDHKDWKEISSGHLGVDAPSYFVTGYRVKGDFLRKFQSSPVMVVLGWATDSQVIIKGLWDYGERESTQQWLYPLVNVTNFVIRRIKIRGKGRSLQLRFDSDGSNHFSVLGWSTFDTGGQTP